MTKNCTIIIAFKALSLFCNCSFIQSFTTISTASGTGPSTNLPAPSTSCSTIGDINFVAGASSDGRVYVCDSDYRWKTICSDGFDNNEATVICRSLGLSTSSKAELIAFILMTILFL